MKVIVKEHKLELDKTPVNELEVNVTKVEFEFPSSMENLVKEAYFTLDENTYKVIIQNNECNIPSEVLVKKGTVTLGVVVFEVQDEQTITRYNPSPVYFDTWSGSLKEADNSEPITPSEMEQFEAQLQEGLDNIDDKIDEVDTKIDTIDDKIEEVNTAIEETNNLDIDIDKQEKETTITLTKKDGTTKSESVLDGVSLQFMWQGTSLGIKTEDDEDYTFVNIQGPRGPVGPQGNPFQVKKTYATIDLMIADYDNMELNDYVMISGNIEEEDNAKLFVKTEQEDPVYRWQYLADFSGASGVVGPQGASVTSALINANGELILNVE